MSDPEIVALRAKLASRPRSDDYHQRRRDIDARGLAYGLAGDVVVEPVTAGGVRAEWTSTPNADRDAALLYLHGGGYVIGLLPSTRSRPRSRMRSPVIAFCWREASTPVVLRWPATAPAADWWSRRCWRSGRLG